VRSCPRSRSDSAILVGSRRGDDDAALERAGDELDLARAVDGLEALHARERSAATRVDDEQREVDWQPLERVEQLGHRKQRAGEVERSFVGVRRDVEHHDVVRAAFFGEAFSSRARAKRTVCALPPAMSVARDGSSRRLLRAPGSTWRASLCA